MAMSPTLGKRPSSDFSEEDGRSSKRQRIVQPPVTEAIWKKPANHLAEAEETEKLAPIPSHAQQARDALQWSIALALRHVGFDAVSKEAMESFVTMAESYAESFAEDVMDMAQAARRTQPIPPDFEATLQRFNLSTGLLRKHLRNPLPKTKLQAAYQDPSIGYPELGEELPFLAPELSGQAEKDQSTWVPKGFPDFPSIHTYRYTEVNVEDVTVRGSGLKWEDGTPFGEKHSSIPDGPRGDPQKMREAAAKVSQQAEEALRGLVRASKINELKEVRADAERNPLSKKRYSLWEAAMQELIADTSKGKARDGPVSAGGRTEIADHSMMVNAEKAFHRKELQRSTKKSAPVL